MTDSLSEQFARVAAEWSSKGKRRCRISWRLADDAFFRMSSRVYLLSIGSFVARA